MLSEEYNHDSDYLGMAIQLLIRYKLFGDKGTYNHTLNKKE